MKSNFQKLKPKVMTYKYFKTFSYDTFREYLFFKLMMKTFAVNFYLFKVSNRNTRKRCEICPKLAIKTPE